MLVTDYIRDDGHSSDAPTITSLTCKCRFARTALRVCVIVHMIHIRVSKTAKVGKRRAMTLSAAGGCRAARTLGSLHTTLIVQETVKECWVKLMDKHLNKRQRSWRGMYTQTLCYTT